MWTEFTHKGLSKNFSKNTETLFEGLQLKIYVTGYTSSTDLYKLCVLLKIYLFSENENMQDSRREIQHFMRH